MAGDVVVSGCTANNLFGAFVDQTNPIDAWAVGRGGQIWWFHNGIWAGVSITGTGFCEFVFCSIGQYE